RTHCNLHRFPTRRSSDLRTAFQWLDPLPSDRETYLYSFPAETRNRKKGLDWLAANTEINAGHTTSPPWTSPRNDAVDSRRLRKRDRKSTRLNSSHGSISY